MQALPAGTLENTWASRGNTFTGAYGEINDANCDAYNGSANGAVAATILEVAFHDNLQDSQLLRDPKVRDWTARASYHAATKYFRQFDPANNDADPNNNKVYTLIPEPPTATPLNTDAAGYLTLPCSDPPTGVATVGAGAAAGYKVYTGPNGYAWADAVTVGNVTSFTFAPGTLPAGAMTYFKVVATNAGGESMQRDVVAAKTQAGRRAPILIVNGFDRFDRTGNDTESYSGGSVERVRARYQNTRDYVAQFAEAVEAFNPALGVETVQNE
jgi:hypothetical protein